MHLQAQDLFMKKAPILFLQTIIILFGTLALFLLLWEPHLEGRNAHATLFAMYFKDLFLAYAYVAAIPFFAALYQASAFLGHVKCGDALSPAARKALRTLRYCAFTVAAFVVGGELYLFLVQRGKDDIAGGSAVGLFIILVSLTAAAAATVSESVLREAIENRSENHLTT